MGWGLRVLIGCLTLTFVVARDGQASDNPSGHLNPPPDLIVEHAELWLGSSAGDKVEGYLTIWNGTAVQASLASIESEAFGAVEILQTDFRTGEARVAPGILQIPGHAELSMRRGGIHLALDDPMTPLDKLTDARLKLVFDGGKELEVTATIIRRGEVPIVHRHGEGDRRAN